MQVIAGPIDQGEHMADTNPQLNLPPEQRQAALAKAAEVRRARKEMLDAVAAGTLSLAEVFDRDDDVAKRTKVKRLLMALPGVGKVRCQSLMEVAGIPENRRVGGLGKNQKAQLLDLTA